MPFLPPVWPSRNRRLRVRLGGRARAAAGRRGASHGLARRRVQEPGSPSSSFGEDPPGRPKLDATPLGSPSAVGCRRSALARFTYPVGVNRAWAWTCRLHVVVRQMLKNITVEDCSPQVRGNRAGMAFVAVVRPWPRAMPGPSRHGLVLEFEAARRATAMASKAAVILALATVVSACCAVASAQTKFGKLVITGIVPCNTGTLIDVATSPAFPDANVELRCGGNVVAGAKTSQNGSFAIEADMTNALAALVGACEQLVDTPLVKCDGKLPAAGALVSYLQGPLTRLLSGIFQLAPAGFSFRMS